MDGLALAPCGLSHEGGAVLVTVVRLPNPPSAYKSQETMNNEDKVKVNAIIDQMREEGSLNSLFHEGRATIHVIKPDYAYLKIGKLTLYFHDTGWAKAYQEEVELNNGEKVTKSVIPFDGWGFSME